MLPVPTRTHERAGRVVVFVVAVTVLGLLVLSRSDRRRGGEGALSAALEGADAGAALLLRGATSRTVRGRLVMVPCHGVFAGSTLAEAEDESAWQLDSWMRTHVPSLVGHVRGGLADSGPDDLLMFSGGRTKREARRSEAAGYAAVAEAVWTGAHAADAHAPPKPAWALEEHARDSFENLLFSVCEYRRIRGRYPESVTVVGFAFKRKRFVEQHARALRLPRFSYLGLDRGLPASMEEMELKSVIPLFVRDPFGCAAPLAEKRALRNPFAEDPAAHYAAACPELAPALSDCGPGPFPGPFPWEASGRA